MRLERTAAVGVAIGFVAVLAVMRHRPAGETAQPLASSSVVRRAAEPTAAEALPARPLPPDEARSSALFDRNRAMPADPDLAAEYEAINDQYFANILPPPQTRWESGLADLGPMIADQFSVLGLTDGRMILINPSVARDPDQRRRALCHEMVHMAVWLQDKEHGPIFQERLRELSLRGAFKGIVASEAEKDATLETLRRKRAALETEERALHEDRETLDRSSQSAVDAYNARVRQQQGAVADYNRLVEQYNLMISYPDGLARERLQPRADGTVR
jgi:hypothetical protein